MPNPVPIRRPLFCVAIRSVDGSLRGESITEAGLTKEAAEAAAERVNELEAPFVARVKRMRWAIVVAA